MPPSPCPAGEGVAPELLALVTYHCRHINAYLARAQSLGNQHEAWMGEWQRLVLYALTDALAHNHLLVGTIAAYLQHQDLDADLLRRYLQSPHPDRYITGEAVDHLDGLTGAVPERSTEPTWPRSAGGSPETLADGWRGGAASRDVRTGWSQLGSFRLGSVVLHLSCTMKQARS